MHELIIYTPQITYYNELNDLNYCLRRVQITNLCTLIIMHFPHAIAIIPLWLCGRWSSSKEFKGH